MIGQKEWIVGRRIRHTGQVWKIDRRSIDESATGDGWKAARWRRSAVVDPIIEDEAQGYSDLADREGIGQILTDAVARLLGMDPRAASVLGAG